MNCKDYYTSVDAIKGADTITTQRLMKQQWPCTNLAGDGNMV